MAWSRRMALADALSRSMKSQKANLLRVRGRLRVRVRVRVRGRLRVGV